MLNFIIGTAGSGKSYKLQQKLIKESTDNPDSRFVLLVPDQYSLEAQKEILDKHPNHGAFNIEVSSFNRLAYEVLDEQGFGEAKMMDELTKSILVRKTLIDCAKDLKVYGGKINMPGFTEKVKSILDELGQYDIDDARLDEIIGECEGTLQNKLKDVQIIRDGFNKYVDKKNLTREELLDKFMELMDGSDIIKNTYIYIDGFTGFTPIQEKVIGKLSTFAKDVTVTATLKTNEVDDIVALAKDKGLRPEDRKEKINELMPEDGLYLLGQKTVYHLAKDNDINEIKKVENENDKPYRIKDNEVLSFISNNIFGQDTNIYDQPQDSLEIHEANSLENEVLSVVKTISSLVRNGDYRYRDFAIITGDMENYYKYIRKLFKKYKIPVFIDYKRSTAENLFADLIISLIRIVEYNFSYHSLFKLLRTGITPISESDIDLIENYVITFRRTTFKSFSMEWKREMKGIDLKQINDIRVRIYDLFKDYMSAMTKKGVTVGDYCQAIYAFLEKLKVNEKIEEYIELFRENKEYALEDEYTQVYAAIIKLLESLEDTLKDETINMDDFEKLVLSGIEELKIGIIPPGIDDVMVGDIERTRLKDIKKMIFLVGANDGIIPKVSDTATIVNDSDREELKKQNVELAPTTKENVFKQMFYLYTMLTKPTEKFVVSYSTQDIDSKSIKESYFVDMLIKMLPKTEIIKDYENKAEAKDIINENIAFDYIASSGWARRKNEQTDEEKEIYNAISSIFREDKKNERILELIRRGTFFNFKNPKLSKKTASDLYGDSESIKVTRAQRFVACPFDQFLTNGLGLREREVYELSPMEKGNIEHAILEHFFGEVKSLNINLRTEKKEKIDEILDKCIKEHLESDKLSEFFNEDPSREFTKSQLAKMAKESVEVLVSHLNRGKFEVSNIEEMTSGGKADRVDTFIEGDNVYVKVIDYKTGNKNFKYSELVSGYDIQVFVYLKDAMEREKREHSDKHIIPAGAFYFHVSNPYVTKTSKIGETVDDGASKEQRNTNYIMEGLLNSDCVEAFDGENNVTEIIKKDSRSADEFAVNSEEYEGVLDYIDDKLEEVRSEIIGGNIDIDPYDGVCEWCEYKGICRVDMKFEEPKKLESIGKKEALEAINGESDVED